MYSVIKIGNENEEQWLALIMHSEQFTPFHREEYLNAVGFRGERYVVKKKDRIVAGILLAINDIGEQEMPPFAPHQGILFFEKGDKYGIKKEQLEAVSVLLEELDEDYHRICFANHFSVTDVRACLWHHYHEPEKGLYDIHMRYTAVKDISKLTMESFSNRRLRDYRCSIKKYNLKYKGSKEMDSFFELYQSTFQRQGILLTDYEIDSVRRIMAFSLGRCGFLRYAVMPDGKKIDAIYILVEGDTAYYIFGANHPDYRKCGGGTFLLIEAMKELFERGVRYFDFVGINSPLRGDFKLSFGAEIKPYYICKKG